MRKIWFALFFVIMVTCIGFIIYLSPYTISNNETQLEDIILRFINRPTAIAYNIDIKQELNLDNKKHVLYTIDNEMGEAELTRGINNKYKMEFVSYGSSLFKCDVRKTNKGKYIFLQGKNVDNEIAYVNVQSGSDEYRIDIPQQEFFVVSCPVPIDTQLGFVAANTIKFFNNNDANITNEMLEIILK